MPNTKDKIKPGGEHSLHDNVIPCRPILFSSSMVSTIMEGRKTQTRRIVKAPEWWEGHLNYSKNNTQLVSHDGAEILYCPHGNPGDRLWVRETHLIDEISNAVFYRADKEIPFLQGWTPSIYMPRWASRITLEIINVSVERVQDITGEDAIDEGWNRDDMFAGINSDTKALRCFRLLWDEINAKRGYGWDVNPWVWVIEFRRV